ncbi:hypothetical protein FNF31_05495 [Cafeteria roenbergensis]|uniref:U-box domain-containing protein n=1 Tax=Cafeteria roenbergensis TaxID=33653 RepID=A0A5A8D2R1_CAFRO|nr:hypothetical protein FNF31_05495 [Cafeteria roenbergensis]
MSAWTEAAGADAPFGKRRLRELAGTPLPESGVPAGLVGALERLVTTVNESTGPDRVLAFVALATAAVAPPARPLVLEALAGLAEDIDALLSAREDVRAGRGQGAWRRDLHEAVLVLLVRCQSYRLAATDVLELVRGDVGLCTELLARLLAVAAYEEDMGTGGGGAGGGGGRSLVHSDSDLDMAAAPAYRTREWAERQWRAMQSERQGREAKARLGGGGGAPPARAPGAMSAAAPPSSPVLATAAAKLAAGGDAGVPADFACGLDGNPMRDPVRRGGDAGAGPAFDRPAIEAWLQRGSTTCPVTGEPLTKADLAPCPELRSRISAWRAGVGAAGPAPRKAVAVMVGGAEELEGDALYDF